MSPTQIVRPSGEKSTLCYTADRLREPFKKTQRRHIPELDTAAIACGGYLLFVRREKARVRIEPRSPVCTLRIIFPVTVLQSVRVSLSSPTAAHILRSAVKATIAIGPLPSRSDSSNPCARCDIPEPERPSRPAEIIVLPSGAEGELTVRTDLPDKP